MMRITAKTRVLFAAMLLAAAMLLSTDTARAAVHEVDTTIPTISPSFTVRFTDSSTTTDINTALREEIARHDLTLFMQFSPG